MTESCGVSDYWNILTISDMYWQMTKFAKWQSTRGVGTEKFFRFGALYVCLCGKKWQYILILVLPEFASYSSSFLWNWQSYAKLQFMFRKWKKGWNSYGRTFQSIIGGFITDNNETFFTLHLRQKMKMYILNVLLVFNSCMKLLWRKFTTELIVRFVFSLSLHVACFS